MPKESEKERIDRLALEGNIAAYTGATDAGWLRSEVNRLKQENERCKKAFDLLLHIRDCEPNYFNVDELNFIDDLRIRIAEEALSTEVKEGEK